MPTLSVVIPCYNEALTIETIVDAVSKSEIEDLEILVVDDLCLLFIHPRGKWDYSARRKQLGRPWVQDLCQKGGYLLPRPDGSRLPHPPPSLPIVALQRRVRFSARLAGFCRGRCHQRRARRAEEASFSVWSLISIFECHVCAK